MVLFLFHYLRTSSFLSTIWWRCFLKIHPVLDDDSKHIPLSGESGAATRLLPPNWCCNCLQKVILSFYQASYFRMVGNMVRGSWIPWLWDHCHKCLALKWARSASFSSHLLLPNRPMNKVSKMVEIEVMHRLTAWISTHQGWHGYSCCWMPDMPTAETNTESQMCLKFFPL